MPEIQQKISLLSQLFSLQKDERNDLEKPIINTYDEILNFVKLSHENYRQNVASFLSCLDCEGDESIAYSIKIFINQLQYIVKQNNFLPFDDSIVKEDLPENINEIFPYLMELNLPKNNRPRLSDYIPDTGNLTEKDLRGILNITISTLEENSKILIWDKDMIENAILMVTYARGIAKKIGQLDIFYLSLNILLERLITSGHAQVARDTCEEILLASYNDGIPEYGYYLAFKTYAVLQNVHGAFMYGNLFLSSLIEKKGISVKLIKLFYTMAMKFYRNVNMHAFVEDLYHSQPEGLDFTGFERRTNDHSYFTSLSNIGDKRLPTLLLDYLNQERENIFQGGIADCTPWLVLLLETERHYPNANFSATGLGFYVNVMKMIVPEENISSMLAMISGDPAKLKVQLKKAIIMLNATRNKADFVFDNENATRIANRIIPQGDTEDFLLAMMIKADYSLVFENKPSVGIAEVRIENLLEKDFPKYLDDSTEAVKSLAIEGSDEIIWLATSEYAFYQLNFYKAEYRKQQIKTWDFKELRRWEVVSEKLLLFDTSVKTVKGEHADVRSYLPEDYEYQSEVIRKNLKFAVIYTSTESSAVLLIKDTRISAFPHNLFLNQHSEYLALQKPMTNIMSVEWLNKNRECTLGKDFSKGIWIPTAAGDWTINQLFSKLEDTLIANHFKIENSALPEKPLDYDLNILTSHGNKDIALFQSLQLNEQDIIHSTQGIVESGKIIILFVCHSGSMVQDSYRNQFDSLIKYYFSLGFKGVIAPFWSLHIDIPPLWLPIFIKSLNDGHNISQAVFNANTAVSKTYAAPGAWACLHLYGNPYIAI